MTTDNFCSYLHRLIQASQTGGQQCSDISPFCIPCFVQSTFYMNPPRKKMMDG